MESEEVESLDQVALSLSLSNLDRGSSIVSETFDKAFASLSRSPSLEIRCSEDRLVDVDLSWSTRAIKSPHANPRRDSAANPFREYSTRRSNEERLPRGK